MTGREKGDKGEVCWGRRDKGESVLRKEGRLMDGCAGRVCVGVCVCLKCVCSECVCVCVCLGLGFS